MERLLKRTESIADIVNLLAGILLFIAPWGLSYMADASAAWTAWGSGVAVVVMAVAALASFAEWEEWIEGAVGLWVILSPWLLHFTADTMAMWSHVALGGVVLIAAMGEVSWRHMHHGATTA